MIYILKLSLDFYSAPNGILSQYKLNTQDQETVSWQNCQNCSLLVGLGWPFLLNLPFLKSYSDIMDLTDRLWDMVHDLEST